MSRILMLHVVSLAIVTLFFVGTVEAKQEPQFDFFHKVSGAKQVGDSNIVTNVVSRGARFEQAVASIQDGSKSESTKTNITFKQKSFGTIAPFVDGKLNNVYISIPATFTTYNDDTAEYLTYITNDPDDETVFFSATEDEEGLFTVDAKGRFLLEDKPITTKLLKKEGLTNIELKKGLFAGMEGYFALSVIGDTEFGKFRSLLVYVPESETVTVVNLIDTESLLTGVDQKNNKKIWDTFVKSVFSQSQKQVARSSESAILESEPYENSLYTINLPKGWTTCECENDYDLWLFDTIAHNFKKETFTSNINITGELTGETAADLVEYINSAKEGYADVIDSWKFQEGKKITVNKTPAALISGTFKTETGLLVSAYQLVVIKNGVTYILTAEAPKIKWSEYEKVLKASLLSFKLK